jgi:uncharacterized OB-fold protein
MGDAADDYYDALLRADAAGEEFEPCDNCLTPYHPEDGECPECGHPYTCLDE